MNDTQRQLFFTFFFVLFFLPFHFRNICFHDYCCFLLTDCLSYERCFLYVIRHFKKKFCIILPSYF
jgi:hypothetical protein